MRKLIVFLIIFMFYLLPAVAFPFDLGYYLSLNIPLFSPSSLFIGLSWLLIYFLNSLCLYKSIKDYELNNDYYFILILNYLLLLFFSISFFILHNLLLSLIINTSIFISTYLYLLEVKKLNKELSYLLIPYLIFSFILLLNMISIYIIN